MKRDMYLEIERKFLVIGDDWKCNNSPVLFKQGYIQTSPCVVRIRIEGVKSYLTIKKQLEGISRCEFEYPIPMDDALYLLDNLCKKPFISKYRYTVFYEGISWVIDEFLDENKGLIIAEVELKTEDQSIILPSWVGQEVSNDPRYYNSNLVQFPFSQWSLLEKN